MQKVSVFKKALRLFFLLVLVNVVGYIASGYMTPAVQMWYDGLEKSALNPPDIVFPVVWSILFLCLAVSAFLVWGKASPRWFVVQLALNMAWSFAFFFLKNPAVALGITVVLLFAVYKTFRAFYPVCRWSGWLQVPVFLWCLFALYLNAVVVVLN